MTTRITVDPITRIEGHLRIDVEVDDGKVTKAWSSGQMWRGIEKILVGRDPVEAWSYTQRFCGVCTTVHAITSVRAVENALNLEVPLNAQLIRNIIQTAHAIQDHIVHFYLDSILLGTEGSANDSIWFSFWYDDSTNFNDGPFSMDLKLYFIHITEL